MATTTQIRANDTIRVAFLHDRVPQMLDLHPHTVSSSSGTKLLIVFYCNCNKAFIWRFPTILFWIHKVDAAFVASYQIRVYTIEWSSLPMLTSFGFPFLLFFCQPFCIYENTYHPASANSVILEDFRTYDVTASLLIASKSLLKCSWGYLQNAFKFCSQPGGILSMLLLISPWISP